MKTSTDRILTTHVGSLPRPKALYEEIVAKEEGRPLDEAAFERDCARAVEDVVQSQVESGIDVVSDGEMSKLAYTLYVRHRLTNIVPDERAAKMGREIMVGRDRLEHPDFSDRNANFTATAFPGCVGPVAYADKKPLEHDLAHLKAAVEKSHPAEAFMTAPSPGILTRFIPNLHYKTEDAYVAALAEAMKPEYRAIVAAGFLLQIDCPDLGSARNNQYRDKTDEEFLRIAERNVALLNAATEGLPPERMRLHICWGNYEGPHTHDFPLAKIAGICLSGPAAGVQLRRRQSAPRARVGGLEDPALPRRQDPHPRRHRFDHEFRRASAPRGAAPRALCRRRGPRARHRRRRLRLRHGRERHADGGAEHRVGEVQGARRGRGAGVERALALKPLTVIARSVCSEAIPRAGDCFAALAMTIEI